MAQVKKVERLGYTIFILVNLIAIFSLVGACGTSIDSGSNQYPGTDDNYTSSAMQVELTLEELVHMADIIATGTIDGHKSYWNDEKTNITTDFNFSVVEFLFLTEIKELIIKEPGGMVEDVGQQGGDSPDLSQGENVLLFLKRNADCTYSVAGGSQGKYVFDESFHFGTNGESLMDIIQRIDPVIQKVFDSEGSANLNEPSGNSCEQVRSSSSSAMQVELSLEELIYMADLIVTGVITGHQSYWNDEKTLIFSNYNLVVDQYLKLNDDKELIIRELGGQVGDIGQEGGDGPDLSQGENVLLFLKRNADCTFSVAGGSQGKYILNEFFELEDPKGTSFITSLKDILIEKED